MCFPRQQSEYLLGNVLCRVGIAVQEALRRPVNQAKVGGNESTKRLLAAGRNIRGKGLFGPVGRFWHRTSTNRHRHPTRTDKFFPLSRRFYSTDLESALLNRDRLPFETRFFPSCHDQPAILTLFLLQPALADRARLQKNRLGLEIISSAKTPAIYYIRAKQC